MLRVKTQLFVSYSHRDDLNTGGCIEKIVEAVRREFEVRTGETLDVFFDRDQQNGISWGDEWKSSIEGGLQDASILLAFLSPSYFKSEYCRAEFSTFVEAAVSGSSLRQVLPVLFSPFESEAGPLEERAASIQWEDWSEIRQLSVDSETRRAAIARMTEYIVTVISETADVHRDASEVTSGIVDEEPAGAEDLMVEAETSIVAMQQPMEDLAASVREIGQTVTAHVPNLERANSFAKRVAVYRKIGADLMVPIAEMDRSSGELERLVMAADRGMQAINSGQLGDVSFRDIGNADEFVRALDQMSISAEEPLGAMADLGSRSKDLRPLARAASRCNSRLQSVARITASWMDG